MCMCASTYMVYIYPTSSYIIVAVVSRNTECSKREVAEKKRQFAHFWKTIGFLSFSILYDLSLFISPFFIFSLPSALYDR